MEGQLPLARGSAVGTAPATAKRQVSAVNVLARKDILQVFDRGRVEVGWLWNADWSSEPVGRIKHIYESQIPTSEMMINRLDRASQILKSQELVLLISAADSWHKQGSGATTANRKSVAEASVFMRTMQ